MDPLPNSQVLQDRAQLDQATAAQTREEMLAAEVSAADDDEERHQELFVTSSAITLISLPRAN